MGMLMHRTLAAIEAAQKAASAPKVEEEEKKAEPKKKAPKKTAPKAE